MKIGYVILFVFLSASGFSQNSSLGFGFRAGLSFAKLDGPSETGPNGEELEKNKMASGFHIGLMANFKFSDLMGLRGEFLYSQRGNQYAYEGPSYFILGRGTTNPVILTGTRSQTLDVSNSYLDIPVLFYYKIGYFELSGGLNTGILISSTAGGNINFNGRTPNDNPVLPFETNLNYNYLKDDAGFASQINEPVSADGFLYGLPTFLGAYYDFTEKDKSLYKTLDFGLNVGLSYFLNDGLFLGVKYIHGFGDVDNNEYDISLKELNTDGSYVRRADVNSSRSWQFSVGFAF